MKKNLSYSTILCLSILLFLAQISQQSLNQIDLLDSYSSVGLMVDKVYADENRHSHYLIGGYDDYTFGLAYADRTNQVQAGFLRHGNFIHGGNSKVVGTLSSDVNGNLQAEVSACKFNDQLAVVYGQFDNTYMKLLSQDGSLSEEYTITTFNSLHTFYTCKQMDSDTLLFSYIVTDGDYETVYKTFKVSDKTFPITETLVNPQESDHQVYTYSLKLKSKNEIIVYFTDRGQDKYAVIQRYNSLTGAPIGSNKKIFGREVTQIREDENGDFVQISWYSNTDFTKGQFNTYDSEFNKKCEISSELLKSSSKRYGIQTYQGFSYITFQNGGNLYGVTIRNDDCEILDRSFIQGNITENQNPTLEISEGTEARIFGLTAIEEDPLDPTQKTLNFYTFFLDQKIACAQSGCYGCFNGKTCPVCAGTNIHMRIIRKVSDGVCTCQPGYFNKFPTEIDCQQCDINCQSCSTSESTCSNCNTPSLRDSGDNCKLTQENCQIFVSVRSKGAENQGYVYGYKSQVFLNGKEIQVAKKTGLYFIHLNDNGEVLQSYLFSSDMTEEEIYLDSFIDGVPAGRTVIVFVNGNVNMPRNPVFYTALEKLGFISGNTIEDNEAFVMFGKKGENSSNVQQQKVDASTGVLLLEGCVKDCSYKCTSCSMSGENTSTKQCYNVEKNLSSYSQCTTDACTEYNTKQDAIDACELIEECGGVLQNSSGKYETRIESKLITSATDKVWSRYQCDYTVGTLHSMKCDGCSDLINRELSNNCDCQHGWIDLNVATCSQCHHSCNGCTGTTTTCDACSDLVNRDTSSSTCPCNDKFYDNNVAACASCHRKCAKCDTSPENCDGCSDVNRDPLDSCNCKTGWFDNGVAVCVKCHHSCKKCSGSATNCTECSDLVNRDTSSSTCPCKDRWFDNGVAACVACHHSCATCSGSSTNCTECSDLVNRDTSSSTCPCNDRFYDNNVAACASCHRKCAKCDTSPENCDGCSDVNRDPLDSCNCKTGWFDDGTSECKKCHHSCESCNGFATNCSSCSDVNRDSSQSSCPCKDKYFDNGVSICESCHYKCAKCSGNSENCSECTDSLNRFMFKSCDCKDGTFDNGTEVCQSCDSGTCERCVDRADNCINPCHSSCAQCDFMGDCTVCPVGTYLINKVCDSCSSKCFNCDQSDNTTCTVCNLKGIGRSFDLSTNCGCKEGYYEVEGELDCLKCPQQGCKSCNNEGICLECLNSDFVPPLCQYSQQGNLLVENPSSEIDILPCSPKCQKCSITQDNCEECIQGINRMQSIPCLCESGYHDFQGTSKDCFKCSSNCSKCLGPDICIECVQNQNLVLNKFSQQCECMNGYKENSNRECEKCYSFKGKCYQECPKNTRENDEQHICEFNSFTLKDNIALFIVCFGILAFVYCIMALVLGLKSKFILRTEKRRIDQVVQKA